ncbi:MAG: hypothetical protein GF383_07820 [Candidatus Lokiarchaeota archaeon]|nr:hypothetical protein [Candidatus Lokiarchaeota archaeon]MBD3340179.1 hypothetical protein [Candidatus Lokiarchaeota archaeon]
MSEKDKDKKAKEIAKIMTANMEANMKDPEKFWLKKKKECKKLEIKLQQK